MRALILLASWISVAAPAVAQEIYCEGLIETKSGDIIAGYTLNRDGSIKSRTITWMPVRDVYSSFDSAFMRSPRLFLHFREESNGELTGPTDANVATTQFEVPGVNRATAMSRIKVQAIGSPGNHEVSWKASEPAKGEPELAKMIRLTKPSRLSVNFLGPDGKAMVAAEFDLTKQAEVRELLPQAKAKGEREVANYKRLVEQGRAPAYCPTS
jgi:hypothetical protein